MQFVLKLPSYDILSKVHSLILSLVDIFPAHIRPGLTKGRDARSFTQTDIYDSMNFVADKNKSLPKDLTINEVADTWIDQERLPLVTVTRNYDNSSITFSQVRRCIYIHVSSLPSFTPDPPLKQ